MTDDLADKGERDRSHIAMTQPHEVRYWTRHLGVDVEMLQALVAKVGNSVVAVRKEIAAQNQRAPDK
jgi:hypothetical protein